MESHGVRESDVAAGVLIWDDVGGVEVFGEFGWVFSRCISGTRMWMWVLVAV